MYVYNDFERREEKKRRVRVLNERYYCKLDK